MSFLVIELLQNELQAKKNPAVFEFGSGGSTLFFLDRGCSVVSIEYDEQFYNRLKEKFTQEQQSRIQYRYIPKDTTSSYDPEYSSMFASDQAHSFKQFAQSIDGYEDESFDIVMIDGRARVACLRHSLKKLKAGGILVFNDTFRARYKQINEMVPNSWKQTTLAGVSPWQDGEFIKETTIFYKPTNAS